MRHAARWYERDLVCPRDRTSLVADEDELGCREGHVYPLVDGIPVLIVDDLEPTQPGYWANAEQIAAARSSVPPPVAGTDVDPYVAKLIVGTHGNLYRGLGGRLPRYPVPEFPLPPAHGETLLDVGCNWGRWTISAARAGYRPIGLDPSFEAISAARRIAIQLELPVRYVVGDARRLPFPDGTFDVVFSYSVLQHFSKTDAALAVEEFARVLGPSGYSFVQMPNALGIRNLAQLAARGFRPGTDFDVRYWRPRELRRAFGRIGPTALATDGFFTLNPQPSDLDLLPRRYRALVRASEALRRLTHAVPALTNLADSVVVRSQRA